VAVKKSELYSSLWKSCDKLRGGMDASQYKDYVLTLLFVKYVSDRAKTEKIFLLDVPEGGSFDDLVALKGKPEIGDGINKVIGRLAEVNGLEDVIGLADFNDDSKLGKGKEMVDRLSDLVAIFENPALDFSGNQADGDDLLGDAYEYLMRNFATESGKSKGQFYTPAEVSRIVAHLVDLSNVKSQKESIYDPACGSGSLLLKAHDVAKNATGLDLAIYGQEKDNATAALSRMNMWLHGAPTAEIANDNTLSSPQFTDPKTGSLKTFDYVVANPPFSVKSWTDGVNVQNDPYDRFRHGTPPEKNGDYAFLLHILASMKSTGKGAVILPHGVLFRGNAEAEIRRHLVKQGYVKAIIGLPANLFYGTGIPACIIVLDKKNSAVRDSIFMIDASKGFIKDGPKNRLRERDVHKIISVFENGEEVEGYSRSVPVDEIAENDYNLNIPRYIDTAEAEDIQDLYAHINGGIPNRDIEALEDYWSAMPKLKIQIVRPLREGYSELVVTPEELHQTILNSEEFVSLRNTAMEAFERWTGEVRSYLETIDANTKPKDLIRKMSEGVLNVFELVELLDEYAIYQGLMEYWEETMKDDIYLVAEVGWKEAAKLQPLPAVKKGESRSGRVDFKISKIDYRSELLPRELVLEKFFSEENKEMSGQLTEAEEKLEELSLAYGGEDMLLSYYSSDKGVFTKTAVTNALKGYSETDEEHTALTEILTAIEKVALAKKVSKDLDEKVIAKYQELNEEQIKEIAVNDKWIRCNQKSLGAELEGMVNSLLSRLNGSTGRYDSILSKLISEASLKGERVMFHIQKMGFA
jgi:type I restriction enzyme M protein